MSFSCPNQTSLTDTDLNATFGNGVVRGLLPSSANPASDRSGDGMLNKNAVQSIVSGLKGAGVIPDVKKTTPELLAKKQKDLLKNVQSEYCFYEARYKYSLQQLLNAIQVGYMNNTGRRSNSCTEIFTDNSRIKSKIK